MGVAQQNNSLLVVKNGEILRGKIQLSCEP